MHLSNFRPVKRVTDVIEIFALVREKMPAKLVMIGDGPDRGVGGMDGAAEEIDGRCFIFGEAGSGARETGTGRFVFAARRIRNHLDWRRWRRWRAKCPL